MSLSRHAVVLSCAALAAAALLYAGTLSAQSRSPVRVVAPENLDDHWIMNRPISAAIPDQGRDVETPGCASVSFIVDRTGHTRRVKLQKLAPENEPVLGEVAVAVAAAMTFVPTGNNASRDEVFSWLVFPFNMPKDDAQRRKLVDECSVDAVPLEDR